MAKRVLDATDLWDMVVGGSAVATGGGGAGPTREQFDGIVEPALAEGLKPTLIDPGDIPADELVYVPIGVGGGVRREEKERWLSNPGWDARRQPAFDQGEWIASQLRQLEYLYPSCDWSEPPGGDFRSTAEPRLEQLVGKPSYATMPFEIGPNVFMGLLSAARAGKPVVDADVAGFRAVPEVSLCSFNVHQVGIGPVVFATAWGDRLVLEQVLNWQRFEDLNRQLAVACGGGVGAVMAVSGAEVARTAVAGTPSKAIAVGRAIREAVAAGQDPAEAAARAAGGHVLFRGRVQAQLNEDKGAFIWGDERIEGTGDYAGHTFRIWYKNENHMSWLDGRPYVMSPDCVTVLDARTGYGLSNFNPNDWRWGHEVAVIGVPSVPVWRTERGLRIFHPWRWGFACDYTPIEQVIAQ